MFQAVEVVGIAILRRRGQRQPGKALEQQGKRHLELKPGQRRSDAEMDAGSETHVRIGIAPGIEPVGFGKAFGIAIGCSQHKSDGFPLLQPDSRKLEILQRIAREHVKRRIRENQPYDAFVRELLTAQGKVWDNPAIGYYMRDIGMPLDNLANTTRVFLGTRIESAQLSHPGDPELHYLAGVTCMRLQLWGKARQLLQQSLVRLQDAGLRRDAWRQWQVEFRRRCTHLQGQRVAPR